MAEQDGDSKIRKRAAETEDEEEEGTNGEVDNDEESAKGGTNQESQLTSEEVEAAKEKEARYSEHGRPGTVRTFRKIRKDINELLPIATKDQALKLVDYVKTQIPYALEKNMLQDLLSIYEDCFGDKAGIDIGRARIDIDIDRAQIDIDRASLDDLINFINDEDERKMLQDLLPDQALRFARKFAKTQKELAKTQKELAKTQKEQKELASIVAFAEGTKSLGPTLNAFVDNLEEVVRTLEECTDFSQAETVAGTGGTATHKNIAKRYGVDLENDDAAGGHKKGNDLLDRAKEDEWKFSSSPEVYWKQSYAKLKIVAQNWNKLIQGARYTLRKGEKEKEAITKTCRCLRDPMDSTTDWFFPGATSGEVICVQPVFVELLRSIGDCWTEDVPAVFSPPKTKIRSSQIVTAFGQRKKRIADVCMDKPGQFLFLVFDHIMKLFIELKPLLRSKQGHESLYQESLEQVIAHLSKYIYRCFNFYEIGVSAIANGMSATLAYVSVHRLELKMGEKADGDRVLAELSLHKGRKYPLMTRECFDSWTGVGNANGKKKKRRVEGKLAALRNELYGKESPDGG